MKRNIIETVLGAVVLVVALVFLVFSYTTADISRKTSSGYDLNASFSTVGPLKKGDSVRISGVNVGFVKSVELDKDSYMGKVQFTVNNNVEVPADTVAVISSEGLLGGVYLQLQPGAEDEMIAANGAIQYTQAPQNLEELLGRFIFSVSGKDSKEEGAAAPAPQAAASTAAPQADGADW